jgi:FG-GAP-like repeat/SprB repeat/Secretion system C-terminal sorting domain/IPT/TIG domain/PKD domain/FG-GAP repeat
MRKIILIISLLFISWNNYAQTLVISAFSPETGAIGSSVTITGTGFNNTAAQNIVFFGATQATVTAATANSLTVTVPLGATYQYLSVTNLGVNLTAYSAKPFIVTLDGAVAFANKVDFATGTGPFSLSIGDLDGDGKSDLALANEGSNTVSILRNTSNAGIVSFASKVDFATGPYPRSVSIGDIDGDGKPDLAVANVNGHNVSVLRNTSATGTISFATKVDFGAGFTSHSVSIGDIDGDGKPDLAVANFSSNTVSVLRNTSTVGTVSFAVKADFITGDGPTSVSLGDIDGDGKLDLAVANNSGTQGVSVLRNTSTLGNINFATKVNFSTGSYPFSVSIGDLDGDGKSDLVAINPGINSTSVFRNTSTLGVVSFASKVDFATGTYPMAGSLGDIDGDGKPDLAVLQNDLSVYRNTSTIGTVNFSTKIDFISGGGYSVGLGDLDGDGKPDLVAANYGSNTLSVLRQLDLPQGSLTANGPLCTSGTGQLTFTATAGTGPFTVVYNDGTADRTVTGVASGVPFNVFTNPVTNTTTYTLVSVSYPNNAIRTTGFTGASATISVIQGNHPPIPNTGGPYTIKQGSMLTLDASNSSDPDTSCGDSITYFGWDLTNDGVDDARDSVFNIPWAAFPAYSGLGTIGDHIIRLTVRDEFGATAFSDTTLTIISPPTASAQSFCGSAMVSDLVATGTNLQWYLVSTGGIALEPTTVLTTTTYYVSQTINGVESDRTAVVVTDNPIPIALFIVTPNPVACNEEVFFDASTSYYNCPTSNSIVSYDWDLDNDGAFDDATGINAVYTFPAFGTYTVSLRVTDNSIPAKTAIHFMDVTVNQGNHPPIPNTGGPYTIKQGSMLTLDASNSSDPDSLCGDSITYFGWDLTNDGVYDLSSFTSSVFNLTWAQINGYSGLSTIGDHIIRLTVRDEFGATAFSDTTLTIISPPTASAQSFCGSAMVSDLVATGTNLQWYLVSTGGIALEPTTVLTTTTYYVSQTINGVESDRTAVAVTITPLPIVSVSQTNVLCAGASTGSITASATSGTAPYTYAWTCANPSSSITAILAAIGNNPNATGLPAETYTVTVTSANGCQASTSVVLTEPALISILSLTYTDASCYNANDGTITIAANGGTGSLVYTVQQYREYYYHGGYRSSTWINYSTYVNTSITTYVNMQSYVTSTGNWFDRYYYYPRYRIVIKDVNGCTLTSSEVTISQPALISLLTSKIDPICNGGIGTINFSATGGTGTMSYTVNGVPQTSTTFTGSAGAYTVVATDANNCSASTTVTLTEPPPAITSITSYCGLTMPKLTSTIYCSIPTGVVCALTYRFKVKKSGSGDAESIVNRTVNSFNLSLLPAIASYSTSYDVRVAAVVDGIEQPTSGVCVVATPITIPAVTINQCGATLAALNSSITVNGLVGATQYRYTVNGTFQLTTTFPSFRLTDVPGLTVNYGTTYSVSAQQYVSNGAAFEWSPVATCNVMTPAGAPAVQINQCGQTLATMKTKITVNGVSNVTSYTFRVSANADFSSPFQDVTSPYTSLSLNSITAFTVTTGTAYYVKVKTATTTNGITTQGEFGPACSFFTPELARAKNVVEGFNAVAYPNPFADNFMIDVTTSADENVSIKVYDMVGRMIDQRTTSATELEESTIGDAYPAGVYNVTLTQGSDTKSLRVVKR